MEQHHLVWRSQGKLFENGKELPKPTITLCGFGNNLYDADGRPYCHGRVHSHMLHFRWNDGLYALETAEPVEYVKALKMDGWKPVESSDDRWDYPDDIPF